MSKQVWCWRLTIITAEDDEPCVEVIPTDCYTDDVINDLYAYYDWLVGEHRWYIADTDLIEEKKLILPRWFGFVERYGKGERLHIHYWDWRRNEISYSN